MTTSERMRHPADGLYTFNAERARELCACTLHLDAWVARHGGKTVPVTLADMTKQAEVGCLGPAWCLHKMLHARLLTPREFAAAYHEWVHAWTPEAHALALMDALLVRAKREGRVA